MFGRLTQTNLYQFGFRKSGVLLFFFLFFFVLLYLRGALINARYVNIHIDDVDQSAYLNESKDMVQSNYKNFYTMGRNRMPIFISLLSFVYDSNLGNFFENGKNLNILLSIVYLSILFIIFKKYLTQFMAVNLLLIVMFTVFIFRAPYVQSEITFYSLFFIDFLLLSSFLLKPSIKIGVISGVLLGITHLTKAAILPLLIIFIIFFLTNQTISIIKKRFHLRPFVSFSLLIFFFLFSIAPYILHSKRMFGSYFYNVNSTFYIWYDSWDEVRQGTYLYGDRLQFPSMPKELIPGPIKYFKEHNLEQIIKRLNFGKKQFLAVTFINRGYLKTLNYGYYKYIVILFIFLLFSAILYLKKFPLSYLSFLCLSPFFLTVFISYVILVSWYASIASGNRFILIVFLPTIFSLTFAIDKLYNLSESARLRYVYFLFNILLFCFLCYDIYTTSTSKVFFINGAP